MSEASSPVVVASYGGLGAWSAAELDAALLQSAGIRAVVSGDAHHPAPLFTGHQVMLLVARSERDEAAVLLSEQAADEADRVVLP
ncbi:MAG: hypothetical protein KJ698_07310 [Actinobacteria bacterium]|nr:hypothetical protein [Actinomycetota bacterium]